MQQSCYIRWINIILFTLKQSMYIILSSILQYKYKYKVICIGILEFLYNNHPPCHHGHPITYPSTAFAKGFNAWLFCCPKCYPKLTGRDFPNTSAKCNQALTMMSWLFLHSHHLKDIIYISYINIILYIYSIHIYMGVVLNKSSQEPPFRKSFANLSPPFAVP